MKICSVEGCDRELYAKSICFMHYRRLRKNGEIGTATPVRRQYQGTCYMCGEPTDTAFCGSKCAKAYISQEYLKTENGRERNYDARDRRRVKVKGVKMPRGWRKALFEKYPACLACGVTENLTVDHVIPLFMGGKHEVENLQVLCKSHNSSKRNKSIDYRP